MRYNREVGNQLRKDLRVEFGMEWGLTQPIMDENASYTQSSQETKTDRTREIAQKIKQENWRGRE